MSDFSVTKFFRNQYLSEGDIRVNPYSLRNHPDVKILADTIGKMLNVEVEADLGGGFYNGREGYYIKMPRRDFQYWSDETKSLAKAALDKASELSKEYDFEFHDVSDYEIEPGERDWPANIGFFIKEKESIKEMDMNDPVLIKMRAAKMAADKLAKMRADNAGDDGNDKFFDNAKKIAFLKKEREQLMRDMEQEAEPEGGPIADEYGDKLNKIDAAIAKLSGRKEMTYDQAIAEDKSLKKGDIVKFKDGSSIYILGPKGDGYDYKDGKEKGHHPKGWFDMMISSGKAVVAEMKVGDKVTFKSGGGDMEIIGVRDMFASDLKAYRVKNADGETFEYSEDQLQLAESSSSEEKRIAMRAIKALAKYRGVSEDEARNDLIRAANELGSLKEAIKDIKETIELGKQLEEGKLCKAGEAYRKRRMAAGEKSSAYLSGRAVKVCKGQMSGKKKKK